MLGSINKGVKNWQANDVLRQSYNVGITNNIFLIAGMPGETKDNLQATVRFIQKNAKYINNITVGVFVFLTILLCLRIQKSIILAM